MTVVQWP